MGAIVKNKYCRICWNTDFWHRPTGEAARTEASGSYVADYGFGHEEWLFNFSWLQPGPKGTTGDFRYGFLQPIGKYRSKYIGQNFDAFIYTISPNGDRIAIGIIRDVYVPDDAEIKGALDHIKRAGWLDEMKHEIKYVGGNLAGLAHGPAGIINVRFRQDDVQFFEPRFVVGKPNKIWNSARYQPFDWEGEAPARLGAIPSARKGRKKKTEGEVARSAIPGTTYDPAHNRLQNALYDYLVRQYGELAVFYEDDAVDLALRHDNKDVFIEIKIALSAKQCIRQALGQLLEYSFYPGRREAQELVIVGEHEASVEDVEFLARLQQKFDLPVRYLRWASGSLEDAL